jgi:hypothetical protein
VIRKPLLQIACALLLSSLGLAQQTQTYKLPVHCGHTADTPEPPRQPGPHDAKKQIAEVEAQKIDQAGRSDPSYISIPELENFGVVRYRIGEYAACKGTHGCYWADLEAQTNRAQAELKRLIATQKPGEKLAMVLDIDETSLSSYCEEQREGFGYNQSAFEAWMISSEASLPIPGTLALFNQARAAGVKVFFITGRSHEQTDATTRNLELAGYKDWEGLILRNESERSEDTTQYKADERAKIVAKGYRIIVNMGDQWSDLNDPPKTGDNANRPNSRAEISIKLPNPFYFLP